MPKSKKTISRWDTGLVEGPNERDIGDAASASLKGFDVSKIGALRGGPGKVLATSPAYKRIFCHLASNAQYSGVRQNTTDYADAIPSAGFGYGLFQFTSNKPYLGRHFSKKIGDNGEHSSGLPAAICDTGTSHLLWNQPANDFDTLFMSLTSYRGLYNPPSTEAEQFHLIDSEPLQTWDNSSYLLYPNNEDNSFSTTSGTFFQGRGMWCDNEKATLYTVLWCNYNAINRVSAQYRRGNNNYTRTNQRDNDLTHLYDSIYHKFNLGSVSSTSAEYEGPLIHEYSLHDNGESANSWYRPWRDRWEGCGTYKHDYLPTFNLSRAIIKDQNMFSSWGTTTGSGGEYPDGPDIDRLGRGFGMSDATDFNWAEDNPGKRLSLLEVSQHVSRPKVYYVNGFPRIYDEGKEHMHWVMQYINTGQFHNQAIHEERNPDDEWQAKRWVISPNYFYHLPTSRIKGRTYKHNGTTVTESSTTNDSTHSNMWMYHRNFTTDSAAYYAAYPQGFFHIENSATYMNPFTISPTSDWDAADGELGTLIKLGFEQSDTGGWLEEHGKPHFYIAGVFDHTQQGPVTNCGNEYVNSYPGLAGMTGDCKLTISFGTRTDSGQMNGHGLGSTYTTQYPADTNNPEDSQYTDRRAPGFLRYAQGFRLTGYRLYYSYQDDSECPDKNIYLLLNVDWDKGYQVSGDSKWQGFHDSHANSIPYHLGADSLVFNEPLMYEDFALVNGYVYGDTISAQFRTACVAKGRVFAGNVSIAGHDYPDRILKSAMGSYGDAPDVFPGNNQLNLTTTDAGTITHLDSLEDNLLVFKETSFSIVDISEVDSERVVDTYQGNGIVWAYQSCQCKHGVVWINSTGCWLFNGEEVTNLLFEDGVDKISLNTWREKLDLNGLPQHARCSVQYHNNDDKLYVAFSLTHLNSGDDDDGLTETNTRYGSFYIYDFETRSWSEHSNLFPRNTSVTNMIQNHKGNITFIVQDESVSSYFTTAEGGAGETYELSGHPIGTNETYTGEISDGSRSTLNFSAGKKCFAYEFKDTSNNRLNPGELDYKTKFFEFDNLGGKKSIKKIYLTYKMNDSGSRADSFIVPSYYVDGGTDKKTFSNTLCKYNDKHGSETGFTTAGGLKTTANIFRTIELIPNDKTECKKVNSFQFGLDHTTTNGAAATGTIQVAAGNTALNSSGLNQLEGSYIDITSTDGTLRRYMFVNETSSVVNTGGIIIENSDMGVSGHAQIKVNTFQGRVVAVVNYHTSGSDKLGDLLNELRTAILHSNGHNGKIACSAAVDATSASAQSITLTQATKGFEGNTVILEGGLRHATQVSNITTASFSGGTGSTLSTYFPLEIDDITIIYREHSTK